MKQPARPTRSEPTVVGLHLQDAAAHLVRLAGGARTRLLDAVEVPLAPGAVRAGVPGGAGRLPEDAAAALRRWVGGDPVRVALATADAVVVPLGAADPMAVAAGRVAAAGVGAGDAVWADVVQVLGRPAGLAAARRSTVLRTRDALGRAGIPPVAIDAAPVALVALGYAVLPAPPGPWTLGLCAPGGTWQVTVGRGGRLEGGPVAGGVMTDGAGAPGRPPAAVAHAAGAAGAAEELDLLACVRHALGGVAAGFDDARTAGLALATGAALAGLPGAAVASPDLGAAVLLRPLGPAVDGLPRWAVEALPPAEPARPRRTARDRRSAR